MWQRPAQCDSGACVEVMLNENDFVLIRASEMPMTRVVLTPVEMSAFVKAIKAGEYDDYIL